MSFSGLSALIFMGYHTSFGLIYQDKAPNRAALSRVFPNKNPRYAGTRYRFISSQLSIGLQKCLSPLCRTPWGKEGREFISPLPEQLRFKPDWIEFSVPNALGCVLNELALA